MPTEHLPFSFTLMLTGQLPFILLAAAVLAYPASILLLHLYHRAVLRSMGRRADVEAVSTQEMDIKDSDFIQPARALQIVTLPDSDDSTLKPAGSNLRHRILTAPWRASVVYTLGGLCFAAIMAFAFLVSGNISFSPLRFFMLVLNFIWPLALTFVLVAGSTIRIKLTLVLVYFGIYAFFGVLALILSPSLSVVQLLVLWASLNVLPTVLVAAFLTRRVRAVGPMVLTFFVIAITGSVAFLEILARNDLLIRSIADIGYAIGLGATGVFISIILLGFTSLGGIGWFLVLWIRARYERKRVSDQSLILDTLWLLFAIVYGIGLTFEGPLWIFSGLVAFMAYKAVVLIGFAQMKKPVAGTVTRLLLLRVFSLGKRSEQLLDAFALHWRYFGSIQMIAGPDLATSTVEPHEFLDFLTGKLSRRFIDCRETFNLRLAEKDLRPDHDWRFRINEFFCFDDTWKMVLNKLVKESDMVLIDLRSFSKDRAGCIFEISELINNVSLERVVLLVDSTTDDAFLRHTIEQVWRNLRPSSPNFQSLSPCLRFFRYAEANYGSLDQLLCTLCTAPAEASSN